MKKIILISIIGALSIAGCSTSIEDKQKTENNTNIE